MSQLMRKRMGLFKKLNWIFIKGAHGYGHEIIQTSKEGGKRVAILESQDSVQEEFETGYSIVPKTKVVLKDESWNPPDDENRFNDDDLMFNGKPIAHAPQMYNLLLQIRLSGYDMNVRNQIDGLMKEMDIKLSDMIDDKYKKERLQQE